MSAKSWHRQKELLVLILPWVVLPWVIVHDMDLAVSATATADARQAPSTETIGIKAPVRVIGIELVGARRTYAEWVQRYLGYDFPRVMGAEAAETAARKLLTTEVFSSVTASFVAKNTGQKGDYLLRLDVEEKWTAIPVIRGVYGGGTPLTVLGAYDTHSFGRLLTLGGEVRRYGNAAPGFVLYARDPRRDAGRSFLGLEFWRDFRRRQILDRDGKLQGSMSTNATLMRFRLLKPFSAQPDANLAFPWKAGFNLEGIEETPPIFDAKDSSVSPSAAPPTVFFVKKRSQLRLLPTLQFDNVQINQLDFHGTRWTTKWGTAFDGQKSRGVGESELYWYQFMPFGFNWASHFLIGYANDTLQQSQYFLGGFDSIRGFPDGIAFGSRAAYLNNELRFMTAKWQYLWLQSLTFVDVGGAGPNWDDALRNSHASAGMGVRLAVPQVYRLMLRIDYAWAIDGSGTRGITAGLNQFFDPYKPL